MIQREFVGKVIRSYKDLLSHLENKCLDIRILNRMLNNDTLFDIGVENESECTPYRHAFIQLKRKVRKLPAKDQAIIEKRIRQVIRKTIDEWQKHQRCQDIDGERTKMLVKEELIRSILADL